MNNGLMRRVEKLEAELMAGPESPRVVIEVCFVCPDTRQVVKTMRVCVPPEETPEADSETP